MRFLGWQYFTHILGGLSVSYVILVDLDVEAHLLQTLPPVPLPFADYT